MSAEPQVERSPKVSDEVKKNHLLYVRLPLRDQCAFTRWQSALYRGQP